MQKEFIYPRHASEVTPEMLEMPVARLIELSRYPLTILPTCDDLYSWIARFMADEVKENNAKGKPTRWIIPLGPKGQYPLLAKILNDEKISLKDTFLFHMDECLDWQGYPVPYDHPFSFHRYADEHFYNLLGANVKPPLDHIVYPNVFEIEAYSRQIQEVGGIDTTFAGFGYRGHLAFQETPNTRWQRISAEEFAAGKTRILKILEDSIIAHSQRGTGGYTQCIPQMAITAGMKDMLSAKRILLLTDGGSWKQWMLRVFLLAIERDSEYAITLCHGHKNVRVACDAASAAPISTRFGRHPQGGY
jgi:glucosamine-6-phosphate deaminase